jgi:hypothetical protein
MIVKELDDYMASRVLFAKAGRAAEDQMAHYLHRAYGDDATIRVHNNLRLERDGDGIPGRYDP